MSKHKNVHPDHYKTGGSLRQGDDIVQKEYRERLAREKAELERKGKARSKPKTKEEEEANASENESTSS